MPLQLAQAATEAAGSTAEASGSSFPPLAPEVLFHIGPLGVTNTILYTYLVMVVLVALAVAATRRLKEVPAARSLQTLAEVVINALLNVAEGSVGRRRARQIFPLMGTLFIFILV